MHGWKGHLGSMSVSLKPLDPIRTLALAAMLVLCSCQEKEAPAPAPQPEAPAPAVEETAPAATTPETPAPAAPAPEPENAPAEAKTATPEPAVAATGESPLKPEQQPMKEGKPTAAGLETITLGGGCFWCTEAVIERLEGVSDVVSGYMGGHVENPTYEQITTKTTGHAEVIQVSFDPAKISLDEILDVFWQAHDPTTLNRQGADVGPQYRSVIFYNSPEQKRIAEASMKKLDESKVYDDPAVTEIAEVSTFWEAEDYHQNYYVLNKDKNPYCRVVISPKLKKLGLE